MSDKLIQAALQALEALELLRTGLIQMREHAEQYGETWARAYVKEFRELLPGSAEDQFRALNHMHRKLVDVADGVVNVYDAIGTLRQALEAEQQATVKDSLTAQDEPVGMVLVPKRMNAAMRRVTDEEGWEWRDVLAAANAITEDEYAELGRSQQQAEPVAWMLALKQQPDNYFFSLSKATSEEYISTPLYTHPPVQQPLPPQSDIPLTAEQLTVFKYGWKCAEEAHGIKEST